MSTINAARRLIGTLAAPLYDFEPYGARNAIVATFAGDALLRLCHPLTVGRDGAAEGGEGYWNRAIGPLAFVEHRDEREDPAF